MLRLVSVNAGIEGKEILKGLNLFIKEGETHVIFGPNGAGKSTLFQTIVGSPKYNVTSGRIIFKGEDITEKPIEERARMGIGVAFQSPPVIRGVKLRDMLKMTMGKRYDEKRVDKIADKLKMSEFLDRDVNKGFSGGEIKRSELLQLYAQNPDFIMFDEPDSGVDLENIHLIGESIAEILERNKKNPKKSGLVITHTGNILDYVKADRAAILIGGRISCIGEPKHLLEDVRKYGYEGCVKRCMMGVDR